MDPCPFVRLIIESLALKLPSSSTRPAGPAPGVHPTTTPCYAKLKLTNFPSQTALLPLCNANLSSSSPPESSTAATGFHLDPTMLRRLSSSKPVIILKLSVFIGRMGRTCGVTCGKLLGSVRLCIDVSGAESRATVYQNGWMNLGGSRGRNNNNNNNKRPSSKLHVAVLSEPDPRYVFQFGGEPECSPVVFQIQEKNIRQPVFSCKFSADRNYRSRSLPTDFSISNNNKRWMMRTYSGDRVKPGRDHRKGWMIIVYDLSGSSIAAASMITPFVPSPGSDRVSRSNPGAWLILRPNGVSVSSWKPWGRLEAWRERGHVDGLGYKFELVNNDSGLTSAAASVPIAEGTMSVKKGGEFCIDNNTLTRDSFSSSTSTSTSGGVRILNVVKGFVMRSSVEGEGKVSKPMIQVGVRHVTCMADAALFIALSAAIDLSMDACQLFSHKLRKELLPEDQDYSLS